MKIATLILAIDFISMPAVAQITILTKTSKGITKFEMKAGRLQSPGNI